MIADFFKNDISQLQRGENAFKSGNVKNMVFDPSLQPASLKGDILASMRNKSYEVEILIDVEDGSIIDGRCDCPRGLVKCHHMAALCLFGHNNISATDVACAWNKPKEKEAESSTKLKDIFPSRDYCPLNRQLNSEEINRFKNDLGRANIVGFSWLLKAEPAPESAIVPSVEELIYCEEYLNCENKVEYIKQKCVTSKDKIEEVARLTIGQSTNENWLVIRKNRLTASKFAAVLRACRLNKYPPSLYKCLVEAHDLSSIRAIQWGRENEEAAIKCFEEHMHFKVRPTGLWLHECGFLGASPDGLVNEDALLEVKCPFKYRNSCLSEVLIHDKAYIISKENNVTVINTSHDYWHQIQGELHIAKKKICYLVVWTPTESEIVTIERDPQWAVNIEILKNFYSNKFISFITQ